MNKSDNVCKVHQTGWPWVGPQPCHGGVHCDSQVARNLADQNQVAFRISTSETSVNTRKRDLSEWEKKTEPGWFWHPEHENHFGCWNWNHENFWMSQPEPGCFQGVNCLSGCQHQNQISYLSGCHFLTNFQYTQHELHHKRLLICSWSHRSSDRPQLKQLTKTRIRTMRTTWTRYGRKRS